MTCLLFGGSGLIGRHLLPRLHRQGVQVTAISRQNQVARDAVTWLCGWLPSGVPPVSMPFDSIICLGPLDNFSLWLQQAEVIGAPRIVAMSSMSAESKRDSPLAAERELAARLLAGEQRLLARCAQLGSACTILRATLIHGGPEGSLEQLAARARRWHVFPVLCGRGLRQPVHADDLALAVMAAVVRPQATGVIAVGGGERMTTTAMFARTRRALARGALPLPIPGFLMGLRQGRQGMATRSREDLIADNTRVRALLGVEPRVFSPQPGSPQLDPSQR